jgi:hypothetical protein
MIYKISFLLIFIQTNKFLLKSFKISFLKVSTVTCFIVFFQNLAREEILANGGSISHHHGGKEYEIKLI